MINRNKIIKGLECCFTDMDRSDSMPCRLCPYGKLPKKQNCQKVMFADILVLLREQEPKLVKIDRNRGVLCPSCGNELFTYPQQKFCDECGQAVKWE